MRKLLSLTIILLTITLLAKASTTKRVIQVKMPAKIKGVTFFYRDSAFSDAFIKFNNLEGQDALINKEVYLSVGDVIRYTISYKKDEKIYTIKKCFIVPETTDTLKFEMDGDYGLHIKSGIKFFIEDNFEMLYNDPVIYSAVSKVFLDNIIGRTTIDSLYQHNKTIINNMNSKGVCTKNEHHILSIMVKTDYYLRLLYWARKNKRFEDIVTEMEELENEKEQMQSVKYSGLTDLFSNYFTYIIARDQLDAKNVRNMVNSLIDLGWYKGITFEFIAYGLEDQKIDPTVASEIYRDLKNYLNGEYEDKLMKISKILLPILTEIDKIYLLTVKGNKITLKQFMDQHPNKFILIDFWASWCKPCREQAPFFERNKQKFSEKNIVFISVSVDKDNKINEWKMALKEDGLLNASNHYQLIASASSPLFKNFKIASIPRYALINAKGKFIDSDFLMPSDENFVDRLSLLIKEK